MTDQRMPPPPAGLPARVSESLEAVWTRYSGKAPGNVETDICRNVVTCTLRGGVIEFSEGMIAPPPEALGGADGPSEASDYKTEAIAAVTRLTRQRVRYLASSYDGATDVATEVFTLEESAHGREPAGRTSGTA